VTSTTLVSGVDVRVNGSSLDPSIAERLLEVRVETHAILPDMFSLRIPDPEVKLVDSPIFAIGADVQVLFQAADKRRATCVFDGLITALEPDFTEDGAIMAVRGYDRSQLLNRTPRTETYQSVTWTDVARAVARRAGLTPGRMDTAGGVQQFVQQSNETDWLFLWRLAGEVGFEVGVEGRKLHFRRPGGSPSSPPIPLAWGAELLRFRPRASGAGQVSEVLVRGWNPQLKEPIVATATKPRTTSEIGLSRRTVAARMGGGAVAVCDRPVTSEGHAAALATAIAEQLANSFVEAEGLAHGDPRLCAGVKVRVTGVGTQFGGEYLLGRTTHVFRSARGYHTELRVCGQAEPGRGPATRRTGWNHPVVVGVVTNNQDPAGLGRVRVKYPALDPNHEGWWARMTAPAAGRNRGLLMLPVVGEEVLVAFEHGSTEHPYILGSVWNGRDLPASLVHPDGSFALRSDKELIAQAAGQITVAGEQAVALQAGTAITLKAAAGLSAESQTEASVKAQSALTLQGVESVKLNGLTVAIEGDATTGIKAGGQLSLQAGGQLSIIGAAITIQSEGILQLSAPQIMLG